MTTYHPPAPPHGLLKGGYQLPILLYRARLGWLLGHRFLLLTHRGGRTGAVHRTVLEVVGYDPMTKESVVLSAYGAQADWFRNIQARPPLAVSTGGKEYTPQFRLLGTDERLAALRLYAQRYRRAFRAVMRFLGYAYDGAEASLRLLATGVVMVAFHPMQSAVALHDRAWRGMLRTAGGIGRRFGRVRGATERTRDQRGEVVR